ncbi:hypothetical protein M569_15922 [Genlisea aurea]|uniref:Uncharacterized protein n=1 Tax=Genlisea aurea TaxID=192259 RepID=S8C3G2_9LAMI|nr:hypothetical protein M569_15922 [Genlisea aurea]
MQANYHPELRKNVHLVRTFTVLSYLDSRHSILRNDFIADEHVVGRRRPVENSNDAAILENTTCPVKEVKRKSNSSSTKRRPASKRRTVESPPNNAAVLAGSESFPGTESGKNEEEPPLSPAEKLINVAAAPAAENPPAAVAEEHRGRRSSWLLDDFGDDWSDPLEFALKTLQGDVVVPIDCNLPIPGSLEDHFQTTTTTTTPLASRTPESEAKQNGNENKGNATVPNFSSFVNLSGKLDHDHPSNP